MPAFFWTSAWAASCHVRPAAPSWWKGSSVLPISNTVLTFGSVHFSLPAIRPTWKS